MKHGLLRTAALTAALMMMMSSALAYTKLQRNDKSNDVQTMQRALNKLGYSLKVDGNFGSGTESAVRDFQKKHGLKVDGIAGDRTLTLIYQLAAGSPETTTVPPSPSSSTRLEKGSSGEAVRNMQQAMQKLGYMLTADGKFGDSTMTAVKSFQKAHGLTADGIAGSQTLTLLYSLAAEAAATPKPTPTPSPAPVTYATLRKNDSGAAVLAMQNALKRLGYSVTADGKFGTGTQTAVKAFQKDHDLTADGAAGNQTLTLLYALASGITTSTPSSAPATAPVTAPAGTITATVNTVSGSLNLRQKQSSSSAILTTIPNHSALTVTSRGTTWCAVLYNGKPGYVMTSFLKFTSDEPAAPTEAPAPMTPTGSQSAIVTTTGGTLNFRASASKSAKVIGQIPNAALLTVTSRGSEWCGVIYNGTSGFVMTSFLSFLTPADDPEPQPQPEEPVASRTLKTGMTGEDVTWVQARLKELGYTVTVNGTYDSATAAAVKSFQSHNCLSSDGIAGSQTQTMLRSDSARRATDPIPSYTTLRIDDTGSGVYSLQSALKKLGYPVTENKTYDTDTHNEVVAFQQRNGLVISGIADGVTLSVLYGGGGKPYSTPVSSVDLSKHRMSAPAVSSLKLLDWYDEVKPTIKAGQSALIYDPATGLSWRIQFYSLGHHADSEPLSWEDTQVMNRSFGSTAWTVHPVYVQLPSGQWTMATMHNRPHLYGSIMDNGFGGHLCIHFLRDVSECIRVGDDDYGVQNQRTLRSAWKALTGETIPEN